MATGARASARAAAHPGRTLRSRASGRGVVVATVLALAQLGCATGSGNPPYPATWATIASASTADGCPDLTGTYANRGIDSHPSAAGEAPSLAEVFAAMALSKTATGPAAWRRSWSSIPRDAVTVALRQTPETLTVSFADAAGNRTPIEFRRYRFSLSEDRVDDLYACRTLYGEPTLRFFNEPHGHARVSILLIGGGGTIVSLLRAVDGSLIVNWRSDDLTITRFVLGSGYQVDNLWYRYPQIPPQGAVDR